MPIGLVEVHCWTTTILPRNVITSIDALPVKLSQSPGHLGRFLNSVRNGRYVDETLDLKVVNRGDEEVRAHLDSVVTVFKACHCTQFVITYR